MGKHWKKRRGKSDNKSGRANAKVPYEDIVKENANFEKYYKCQGIVPEEEWDEFMATLRDPLPACFRISADKWQSTVLLEMVEKQLHCMVDESVSADKLQSDESKGDSAASSAAITSFCLPWYPGRLAWQLNLTRSDIRHSEAYHRLHNFLISETESGNISRQEAVSMIPPLVLDVQSHHKVLDMCAAPGSKTAQLIERLHDSCESAMPEGMVLANDADNRRCYMLVHQAKRRPSPCFVVTNHDATRLPNMFTTAKRDQLLKFDRVLCDVPCSGDGTLRKNSDVWTKWNPINGVNLHGLQYNITYRGLQLLSVSGRLVYSTCSLNPIEDEAVVFRLLSAAQGAVSLVDASNLVPGLKFSPGVTHWTPFIKDMTSFNCPEDVPDNQRTILRPHMFPPSKPTEQEQLHLQQLSRCMRILPHHQNTGGFFVAVFEKLKPLPDESGATETNNDAADRLPSPPRKRARGQTPGYNEDPYCFITSDNTLLPELDKFYELSGDLDRSLLMTRCQQVTGRHKNVYLCSPAVRQLLVANTVPPSSLPDRQPPPTSISPLKVINSGLKVFARCDNKGSPCGYRLTQEGCRVVAPFLMRRRVTISAFDMISVLLCDDIETPVELASLHQVSRQELDKHDIGPMIMEANVSGSSEAASRDGEGVIQAVGWKGASSLRAYVARHERLHLLRLLGADTSKFDRNKFAAARKMIEQKQNPSDDVINDVSVEQNDDIKDKCENIPEDQCENELIENT